MIDADSEYILNRVYGTRKHPYYIYVPRWIDSSAGIKALHFLCHALNSYGENAFLVFSEPQFQSEPRMNPNLKTPVLDQETARAHFEANLTPIAVYSETVPGNPLGATAVVRYLMNFSGVLGGERVFPESELIFSFSSKIAKDYMEQTGLDKVPVLFLPPIDPRDFEFTKDKKTYQVVYAGKYRSFVGKPPKVGNLESYEIFRDGPRMQSRKQVIELLKHAHIVYSFENSSIVTEAILSGTPACFVKNEFLKEIIADEELGSAGMAENPSGTSIENARKSVEKGREAYLQAINKFPESLSYFIEKTQSFGKANGYRDMVLLPVFSSDNVITHHRVSLARQILKSQGPLVLFRTTFHFLLRRLSWRYWNKSNGKNK